MKFDYTKGLKAKYLVSVHNWQVDDFYYFHYFKEAKTLFESITEEKYKGFSVSLYDMDTDVKKMFKKL